MEANRTKLEKLFDRLVLRARGNGRHVGDVLRLANDAARLAEVGLYFGAPVAKRV